MKALRRRLDWLLHLFGVDPVRYWLLMDLFATLSERCEMLTQLGQDRVTLRTVSRLYFVMLGVFAVLLVLSQPPLATYSWMFLTLSTFVLLSVLLSETSNSLVNPVEALVLAHQPVDGATYTAAKLSHLLRILLYLVPGLNLLPALGGLGLAGAGWMYPLRHLLTAFGLGLLAALLCCALFGWLLHIVPPSRLKSAAQLAEILPWLVFLAVQNRRDLFPHLRLPGWPSTHLAPWIASLCVVAAAAIILGIRSLSVDYLLRVSTIVHGSQASPTRSRFPSPLAALLRHPPARAGFEYISRLMSRDWQFRRQLLVFLAMMTGAIVLIGRDLRHAPFAGPFSGAHFLPHFFGGVLFWVCTLLPYGSDYKAAWVFLAAPTRALGPFAHGIFAVLWLKLIAIPHALLLAVLTWLWGPSDAALFTAYSLAVATLYLSAELRLVDGVPFTRQPEASRSAVQAPTLILGGLVIGVIVSLQHFFLFRSRVVVLLVTLLLAPAAVLLVRYAIQSFEIAMRYRLSLDSAESGTLYTEIS